MTWVFTRVGFPFALHYYNNVHALTFADVCFLFDAVSIRTSIFFSTVPLKQTKQTSPTNTNASRPKLQNSPSRKMMMHLRRPRRHFYLLSHVRIRKNHPVRCLVLAYPLPPPILMTMLTLLQTENPVPALTLASEGFDGVAGSVTSAIGLLGLEVATVAGIVLFDAALGFGQLGGDTAC